MEKFAMGFIITVFVTIFLIITVQLVKFVYEWLKNNASPIVSKQVKVVAKRVDYEGSTSGPGYTLYFITFEDTHTGERKEFKVKSKHYGVIAEGDCGILTHQGTRFLHFEINK